MTIIWRSALSRSTRKYSRHASNKSVLEGITVLELSSVLAGPSVSQFLAELGATILKIENKRTFGDVTRTWKLKTERSGTDRSAYFHCCNMGKQSIAVDVTKKAGIDIVHKLAKCSDVVLASYKPGDAVKLSLDYKSLQTSNPALIYASVTGYGHDDTRAGYDAVIQAEAGFQYMNGSPDSLPCKMPVAMVDILAAHQLKQGILVSLLHRERTGEGSFIDVSLMRAAVSGLANQATGYLVAGSVPQRMGSDHPSICPYGTVFETGDGRFIVFAVGTDAQFARLCEVLNCEEMSNDERFCTNASRVIHRGACVSYLQGQVAKFYDRDVLIERLVSAKVPAAGVNAMNEVFQIPQARLQVLLDPQTGDPTGLRQVAFDTTVQDDIKSLSSPPHYGEHTESVLVNTLGLTRSEVNDLVSSGVVDTFNENNR